MDKQESRFIVLRIRCFLTPGSGIRIQNPGWEKIQSQDPGSGLKIPNLIFENLESGFLG
jgi:hypothetical protein